MSVTTIVKLVQDIMRQDAGVDGDAQRISQLVWMLFLKVFDVKEEEWELMSTDYTKIIPEGLRWRDWATNDEGITGDDLLDFINNQLFKELKEIIIDENSNSKTLIVKEVFEDSYNYMKSGTLIRQVINKLNELDFTTGEDRHFFNEIYESILKDLQSAGNSGEYYTPRTVTQFMVEMVNPKLGEKVLDFACGTGGFLVCALEHLRKQIKNVEDERILQDSILGIEKKPLPHMLAITNLILHDIDEPKIRHDNSLTKNVRDYKLKDKVDIILTNPPFGGIEEDGVQVNFPQQYQTKETADLFMVLLMYMLKDKGRAAIVLPDGFLFGEGVKTSIKAKLLDEFNLHTIVRLPNGVFAPYTSISTNLLFLDKGKSTEKIDYYQVPLAEGLKNGFTKTKQFKMENLECVKNWWNNRDSEDDNTYTVTIEEIKKARYNLDFKNPSTENKDNELSLCELLNIMDKKSKNINILIGKIKDVLEGVEE